MTACFIKNLWRRPQEIYEGLVVRCSPGVHELAAKLVCKHTAHISSVLDLAAGTGAWLARLKNAGFTNLEAFELNSNGFGLEGIKLSSIDLNTHFSSNVQNTYGLISAIEIWEHLDCSRVFLREIRNLLDEQGMLLITTPNIGHWSGRLRFMFTAEHRYFTEQDYHLQRHISPITRLHTKLIFEEIGFEIIEVVTVGSFFGTLKNMLMFPISFVFRLCCGVYSDGDVLVYLLRKTKPITSSAGRSSKYLSAHEK